MHSVCGTSTAAAGAFTNVKRLSVFVSSGAQLMRAKLEIHCTVSVCVERAQKEETKIESGGRVGSAKAQTLPLLSSFSSLYLPLSLSLCLCLALSFLGCPNEMWASCRTMKRGSQGCFFTVPEPQCASFNLMFQCKFFFHKLPSPHVCNMAGITLQPPVTMATRANQSELWQKQRFTACLFDYVLYGYIPRGTCERHYGER